MEEEEVEEEEKGVEEKGAKSLSEQEDRQDKKSPSAELPRPEELLSSGASWLAPLAPLAVQWAGLVPASHSAAGLLALVGISRENTSAWPQLPPVRVTCWLVGGGGAVPVGGAWAACSLSAASSRKGSEGPPPTGGEGGGVRHPAASMSS